MSYITNPEKIINRILLIALVIAITYASFTLAFWILMRQGWDNATSQEKIKALEDKVQALTATTTPRLDRLERAFWIKKK